MIPTFSLLHATRGRPQKAVAAARMWFERCEFPGCVEYVLAVDSDDPTACQMPPRGFGFGQEKMWGDYHAGSCPAWESAYHQSTGNILIQMSDDMEPPEKWDTVIVRRMESFSNYPAVLAVSDGFRKDRLLTTFICNRPYAELEGCFLNPAYKSVWSDGEATYRAYQHYLMSRATVIEARDVVFFHRHHWHDRSVAWDKTYADQNSNERYVQGARVFAERNPGWQMTAMPDGSKLVDWV